MRRAYLLLALGAAVLVACGGGEPDPLSVTEVRVGQPTGPNAALYFVASNHGDIDDVLLGASTDVASRVELHETSMGEDGTMGMQAVETLELPAGGALVLEPGGYHLMLIDAERMEVGETIEVTISFEQAGDRTIEAEVVEPGETMDHEGMDMEEDMDMDDEGSDG